MKKVITGVILPILILCVVGSTSCKDKKAKQEQKKIEVEQVKTLDTQIKENVYPLPTSAQVIKMLTELEVGYIIGISNPVENSKKYFSSTTRAINLGVYGADLSYATLYNMQQEVIDYLNTIRSLSNELNMSKIYNEELYSKIKQNFDNRDTLVSILTNSFNDTYAYLVENDQQQLALLVVGGAWVEGMYLTTHVSEAAYQVAGISRVLLEQKKSFELYLDITKPYLTDPSLGDFVKLLDPVKKVYEGLSTSLTEKNIIDITKVVEGVRSQIVQ
jgi:predicted small secreted protein